MGLNELVGTGMRSLLPNRNVAQTLGGDAAKSIETTDSSVISTAANPFLAENFHKVFS
jgi:hypothetical protein